MEDLDGRCRELLQLLRDLPQQHIAVVSHTGEEPQQRVCGRWGRGSWFGKEVLGKSGLFFQGGLFCRKPRKSKDQSLPIGRILYMDHPKDHSLFGLGFPGEKVVLHQNYGD